MSDVEYHRAWRARNPEKVSRAARKWQKKNPERVLAAARARRAAWSPAKRERNLARQRERTFFRRYGLTQKDYDKILEQQNGTCAICPRMPANERFNRLNVDHCHSTGRVRGLLCTPCNHALGALGDNVEGLMRAVGYLQCQI